MKIVMFRSYLVYFRHKLFGIDMTMPFRSANLYLGTFDWRWSVGRFAQLFLSRGNPINGACRLWTLSGRYSHNGGFRLPVG